MIAERLEAWGWRLALENRKIGQGLLGKGRFQCEITSV
jgi:hypothetical protein